MFVIKHFRHNFIKVLQSLFVMHLVPLNLFFFAPSLHFVNLLIRFDHTFKLNRSIHFEFVLELPFATYVELFGKRVFPVREELLSFWKSFAWINNFVPFSIPWSNRLLSNEFWFKVLSLISNCDLSLCDCLIYQSLWRLLSYCHWYHRLDHCGIERSASTTSWWNYYFIWILPFSMSFNRCCLTKFSDSIIIFKRCNIWNR